MFERSDDSWTARAVMLDAPRVEVYFLTLKTFLTGDPNNPAHFDDPAHNLALATALPEGFLRLAEFAAEGDRLIAHYREVATLAARHAKPFDHVRQHFWMRLTIGAGKQGLGVPWYDTWREFDRLLAWIETATEGERFDDIDQGWDVVILRAVDSFLARETDTEGEEYAIFRLSAAPLIASARQARRDGPAVIARLKAMLGTDVWTAYRYDGDAVKFGTADWTPAP
ncbi:MAG: hypothetical protein ACKO1N_06790 [Erythrobacter sp.]